MKINKICNFFVKNSYIIYVSEFEAKNKILLEFSIQIANIWRKKSKKIKKIKKLKKSVDTSNVIWYINNAAEKKAVEMIFEN